MLGLYLAIRQFHFLLKGRPITAFVDHKPLTFAMSKVSEPCSARQQRHLAYIMSYTWGSITPAWLQTRVLTQSLQTGTTGLKLIDVSFEEAGVSLLCNISLGHPRPIVPRNWRQHVFDIFHGLSHPGAKASQQLLASKFVWPGLKKDVRNWSVSCIACQKAKVQRHVKAPLAHFEVPEHYFDLVNIDLVGPLPLSLGYAHLLTMVDLAHLLTMDGVTEFTICS